jgi:hypothetical protein
VRPAAEIGEVALRVEGDRTVGGVDELDLVPLSLLREHPLRLLGRDLLARPLPPFLQLASDLGLDPLEVLLADRLGELEVVVEPVLDRRTDRDLHAGIEPADGFREQVRGGVTEHVERVRIRGVARGDDLDSLPVGEREAQVLDGPVRAQQDRLLGELRPDRPRRVQPGRAVREFEFRCVG